MKMFFAVGLSALAFGCAASTGVKSAESSAGKTFGGGMCGSNHYAFIQKEVSDANFGVAGHSYHALKGDEFINRDRFISLVENGGIENYFERTPFAVVPKETEDGYADDFTLIAGGREEKLDIKDYPHVCDALWKSQQIGG